MRHAFFCFFIKKNIFVWETHVSYVFLVFKTQSRHAFSPVMHVENVFSLLTHVENVFSPVIHVENTFLQFLFYIIFKFLFIK